MSFKSTALVGIIVVAVAVTTLTGCTSTDSSHSKDNASAAADSSFLVVPKLSGLTVADARKKLTKAGLSARTSQPGATWKVKDQSPAAGSHAPRGSAVEIEPYQLTTK